MSYRVLLLLTLLLKAAGVLAQTGPATDRPAIALDRPTLGFHLADLPAVAGDPDGPSLTAFGYQASVPMRLANGRTELLHELTYRHADLALGVPGTSNHDGENHGGEHADGLLHSHAYTYRLTAAHRLAGGWTLTASVAPTLQSRMQHEPDGFALEWSGSGAVSRTLDDGTRVGAGVAYTRLLGRPMVHPVLALEWDNGGSLEADLYLPERAAAWWSPHARFSVGATARLDGDRYRTSGLEALGGNGHVRFVNVTAGPAARLHLGRELTVTAEGGTTLFRSLRAVGNGTDVNFDPGTSEYFRIELQVGL